MSPPLESLHDLYHHQCITVSHLSVWNFKHKQTRETASIRQQSNLQVDDIKMASQFARDGLGLSLLPVSEVYNMLQSGELVMPLPNWFGPKRDLYLIWPSGRLLGAKAQAFKFDVQKYMREVIHSFMQFY